MANTKQADGGRLIGKTVDIKAGHYAGHWGVVIAFDGDDYHVSGGSIGELMPVFSRSEFTVRKQRVGE